MKRIEYAQNKLKTNEPSEYTSLFGEDTLAKTTAFHRSMGEKYTVTPLRHLKNLAERLGLGDIYLKDESQRHPLKAFKLLGGSYAVANFLCSQLGKDISKTTFEELKSNGLSFTFVAASDGNHGKSVAWSAHEFGQGCIVYMPKGTVPDRVSAIEQFGAKVIVTQTNYDGCVDIVNELCEKNDSYIAIPDTGQAIDEIVPLHVMQGYATMFVEVTEQLNGAAPTHVFLQAGVGSFASAMTACLANKYKDNLPKIFIMEPHNANCFFESGKAADGKAHSVGGEMDSIMAGLSCGVPNPLAWEIIKHSATGFVSADDTITANGMRILAAPLPGDPAVTAGESGAVGTGVIEYIQRADKQLQTELGLDQNSVVLLFSTEGDTDTQNYREVVWHGKFGE